MTEAAAEGTILAQEDWQVQRDFGQSNRLYSLCPLPHVEAVLGEPGRKQQLWSEV